MNKSTTFGLTLALVHVPMVAVPSDWKARLEQLTNVSDFAMWRWLYQTGNCHTLIMFEGSELVPRAIVGWACATFEDGPHGVLGVFTDPTRRGLGYGTRMVSALISFIKPLAESGTLQAVATKWPKYRELIEAAGLDFEEWH